MIFIYNLSCFNYSHSLKKKIHIQAMTGSFVPPKSSIFPAQGMFVEFVIEDPFPALQQTIMRVLH